MNNAEVKYIEAKISVIKLNPGDVLTVSITSDELDQNDLNGLQAHLRKVFPNNKVQTFLLPRGTELEMSVVSAPEAPAVKDCSVPTSYCNDCACGKKERIEAEVAAVAQEFVTEENAQDPLAALEAEIAKLEQSKEEK